MKKYYGEEAEQLIHTDAHQNAYDFMDMKTPDDSLIAMTYCLKEITYGQMKENINLYASKLKSYGLGKGDSITIVLPNVPELVYYIYAGWKLGIRVNLIEPRFNPEGIASMTKKCGSKLLITTDVTFKEKIVPCLSEYNVENFILTNVLESLGQVYPNQELLVEELRRQGVEGRAIFNPDFEKEAKKENIPSVYDENMDATVVFTSGSTGFPKGAVFSHDAHNIKVNQISYGVPNIAAGDKFLAVIPFFSAYGINAGMHNGFTKGMNMHMIPTFNSQDFADLICKYQIQTAIGVPKYWELFYRDWEKNKEKYHLRDLSFLRNPVSGGDVIAPTTVEELNRFFLQNNADTKIINGWGSTEGGGPTATTVNDPLFSDSFTSGILFPGVDYIILDQETGAELGPDKIGEIAISDPAGMTRYLGDQAATDEITIHKDGKKYYKMGDLFQRNDDEMLYFEGRTKRAIMLPTGHTVHAVPIDSVLLESGALEDSCTVGIKKPGEYSGAVPVSFIVPKAGQRIDYDFFTFLDEFSSTLLPERNKSHAFVVLDALPYTLMGKVDYKALEQLPMDSLDLHIVDRTFIGKDERMLTKKQSNNN